MRQHSRIAADEHNRPVQINTAYACHDVRVCDFWCFNIMWGNSLQFRVSSAQNASSAFNTMSMMWYTLCTSIMYHSGCAFCVVCVVFCFAALCSGAFMMSCEASEARRLSSSKYSVYNIYMYRLHFLCVVLQYCCCFGWVCWKHARTADSDEKSWMRVMYTSHIMWWWCVCVCVRMAPLCFYIIIILMHNVGERWRWCDASASASPFLFKPFVIME